MKKLWTIIFVVVASAFLSSGMASEAFSAKQPDLVVQSISSLPESVVQGSTFSIKTTVKNIGKKTTKKSVTRFYFSQDSFYSNEDRLLTGSPTVRALQSKKSARGTAGVTVPQATPLGTYYLIACADDTKKVNESEENNNCMASETKVQVVPNNKTLNMSINGSGTVTSNPAGINCNSSCSANFTGGDTVTLTASPVNGYNFGSWSNCDSSLGNTCTVTMNSNRNVTLTFTQNTQTYTLTVTKAGTSSGTLTVNTGTLSWSGNTGTSSYNANTQVTLTASASTGSTFGGWSGEGCSGTGTCIVTMSQARSVTATFILSLTYVNLTVTKTGNGKVTSNPSGIDCGSTCSANFAKTLLGIYVTLTATPDPGSSFSGWGGDCVGAGSCKLYMSSSRTVTAAFTVGSQTVTLKPQYDNQLYVNSLIPSYAKTVYQIGPLPVGCDWSGYYDPLAEMWVQTYVCGQGLVKFDTSTFTGKTIENATLKLVTKSCGVGSAPKQWHVQAMYTSWSPTTVTWNVIENSQFYSSSKIILYPPCYFGQTTNFEINVTGIVQNWANGTWNNYGMIFGSEDYTFPYLTSYDAFEFYSLEDPGQEWPKLIVTYR
jgi:hypothetical protein